MYFSLLMAAACTPPHPVHKKSPPAPSQPQANSANYMRSLTMAHMKLEQEPENIAAATPHIEKMNSAAPKPSTVPMDAVVAVLEYELDGSSNTHSLMVPLSPVTSKGHYQFDALQQVTSALSPHKPEYRRIQTRVVVIAEPVTVAIKDTPAAELRSNIDSSYHAILSTAQPLPTLETARLQLELSRFFMKQNIRDAAYLSLENSKIRLAQVDTSNPKDAQEVAALSKESASFETILHKKLPYKF